MVLGLKRNCDRRAGTDCLNGQRLDQTEDTMAMSLAQMLDPKLRSVRKSARLRLREANKLLRRAKRQVSDEIRQSVKGGIDSVQQALRDAGPEIITEKSENLAALVDKHLDRFRKPPGRESIESVVVAILVALFLRSFVVEAFKIPSGSMIPTLAIGDQIFVNKYVYGIRIPFTVIRLVNFQLPERGDVIVFEKPGPPHENYIKRVVGLPGDEIRVRNGVISINGEDVPRRALGVGTFSDRDGESDRWETMEALRFEEQMSDKRYTVLQDTQFGRLHPNYGPTRVPEQHVFVMGDNRDHSFDSRNWGFVPVSNILGRSMFVWWSWGREGLKWKRLGTWIE